MDADAQLAAFIERVKRLEDFNAAVAREAAARVEKIAKASAAAGTDPYGKPWPTKKDGTRALANAAGSVTARAIGPVIQIVVRGAYAIHHNLKGKSRRPVIPEAERGVPPAIALEIAEAARAVWARVMGGR